MISVKLEVPDLVKNLESVVKNLPKQMHIVNGKAARRAESYLAKQIARPAGFIRVTQKVAKKKIVRGSRGTVGATLEASKTERIGLEHFGGRHTKAGVTYKITNAGSKKTVVGGFMGPRPGVLAPKLHGGVFTRLNQSDNRSKIGKARGPSPFGVIKKQKLGKKTTSKISEYLLDELRERIRYKTLKKSGAI